MVKKCPSCGRSFVFAPETAKRHRGDPRELEFCPTCRRKLTPEDLDKVAMTPTVQPKSTQPAIVSAEPMTPETKTTEPHTAVATTPASSEKKTRQSETAATAPQPVAAPSTPSWIPSGPATSTQYLRALPHNYLTGGYYDQNGLARWVFGEGARLVAQVLNAQPEMTATAMRRFYNQLQAIDYDLRLTGDFAGTQARLNHYRVMAMDSQSRKVVPEQFVNFINRNLDEAYRSAAAFRGFKEHFQSVVAYAKNDKGYTVTNAPSSAHLPPEYLANGYYDGKHLSKEALIDWPRELIDLLARANPSITSSALRRFYNKLKAIEARVQAGASFESVLERIYAFERDAAYAANRGVVPSEFAAFIVKNVDLAATSQANFQGFVEHFQSVIAFGRAKLRN